MPFFAKSDSKRKLKRSKKNTKETKNVKQKKSDRRQIKHFNSDDEIESSSDEEQLQQVKRWKADDDEFEKFEDTETAQEKKERIAKLILTELEEQRAEAAAEANNTGSLLTVQQQLREEVLEAEGKLFRKVAKEYAQPDSYTVAVLQCKKFQRKPITAVAVNPKDNSMYSASLDGSIVKYSSTGSRVGIIKSRQQAPQQPTPCHASSVLSLAVSMDAKFLVSGDSTGAIMVWDATSLQHIDTLKKHRAGVTGLAFQRGTHTLYSCSLDRMVMEWCLDNMAFVQDLGGHSCGVLSLDALYRQSCISCAGADETVIIYNIVEEKSFQYAGKQTSIDGVRLLNEKTFLTYGQDGSICLWSTARKRPVQQLKVAHGYRKEGLKEPHWITALATIVNTDLVATGSSDGFIRLWRVDSVHGNKLHAIARVTIPVGTVNSLEFTADGTALVAGLGRSHKLGRWHVEKGAKNCVLLVRFTGVKAIAPVSTSSTTAMLLKEAVMAAGRQQDETSSEDEDESADSCTGGSNAVNGDVDKAESDSDAENTDEDEERNDDSKDDDRESDIEDEERNYEGNGSESNEESDEHELADSNSEDNGSSATENEFS